MSADAVFCDMASRHGWNAETQAAMLLEYISRQQDDATFEDFLAQQESDAREEVMQDYGDRERVVEVYAGRPLGSDSGGWWVEWMWVPAGLPVLAT